MESVEHFDWLATKFKYLKNLLFTTHICIRFVQNTSELRANESNKTCVTQRVKWYELTSIYYLVTINAVLLGKKWMQ